MRYKDIFKDKKMTDAQGEMLLEALEKWADDNEELKIATALAAHEGHLCEYTAMHKVRKMQPVVYISEEGKHIEVSSMCDYMSKIGVTPEVAYSHVNDAWNSLKTKSRELGVALDEPKFNIWDAYYNVAKAFCVHWYTICGKPKVAASIALEHIIKD